MRHAPRRVLGGGPDPPPTTAATPTVQATTAAPSPSPEPSTPAPEPTAEPSPTPTPAAPAAPAAPDDDGPEESFRTWLAASRAPDAATACANMTDALAAKMVAELAGPGIPGASDCASMIDVTEGLYAAVGHSAEVDVALVEETTDRAVLEVDYGSGGCGLVVLVPGSGHWKLDERSEEQC